MKRRTETRKTRSFHLTPGDDDDLLEWFETVPKGERAATVRAALRAYMQRVEIDRVARMEQQMQQMATTLSRLPELLSRMSLAPVAIANGTATEAVPTLSEDAATQRRREMKKASW